MPVHIDAIINYNAQDSLIPEQSASKDAIKMLGQVTSNVNEVRKKAYRTVFDPKSKEFSDLTNTVDEYISDENQTTAYLALHLIGLTDAQAIKDTYRKSKKFAKENPEIDIYPKLADTIERYRDQSSSITNILSDDNVSEILKTDYENPEEEKEPNPEDMGKKINEITGKTSRRDFEFDVDEINWSGLQAPDEAELIFDQNRPRRFRISLNYEFETGEPTRVDCFMDTTKNTMDWNHLEDPMNLPDNPDLENYRKSLLIAADSMLDRVQNQANKQHQERQSSQTVQTQQERRPKREKNPDPVYQMRKEVKAQIRDEQKEQDLYSNILNTRKEKKNNVTVPDEEVFDQMLNSLSDADTQIVKKALQDYNTNGTGVKFVTRRGVKKEGEPIYSLNINCTDHEGISVLLKEIESGDGGRNFEIAAVKYRKELNKRRRK